MIIIAQSLGLVVREIALIGQCNTESEVMILGSLNKEDGNGNGNNDAIKP